MHLRTKSSLSPARQRLIELLQATNFGRIENLHVRNGEPVFDPPPRIVHEIKFGGENDPRRELTAADFPLKAQVIELFARCDQIGNGVIETLSVKHGLPFSMNVEGVA
jgi:hypothetical protein